MGTQRPKFPANLLVDALRRTARAKADGRYSFVAQDRTGEDHIPHDPKLHEEYVNIKGARR